MHSSFPTAGQEMDIHHLAYRPDHHRSMNDDDESIETSEHEARPYSGQVQMVGPEPMTSTLTWSALTTPPFNSPESVLLWMESPEGPDDWTDWMPGKWTGQAFTQLDGKPLPKDAVFKLWAIPMEPTASAPGRAKATTT